VYFENAGYCRILADRPCISVMRGESMKYPVLIPLLAMFLVANSFAQTRIYRCGNEYTNNASEAQARGCKVVEGGNVTVVEGTRVATTPAAPVRVANAPQAAQRVDSNEQRARDNDARAILESELKKAEARRADLLKEYNNGEPEKQGPEARNHQKYLDRVAELKANIARNESDIAGIRRELGRAGGATGPK
jgi:hypothetical protein